MLLPSLLVTQVPDNPSVLRLEDATPDYNELRFPGGFGGINPSRLDARVSIAISSALNRVVMMDEVTLPATLFAGPGQVDLNRQFSDGTYRLTVRAYATTGQPVQLCDYLMGPVAWQTGYALDVLAGSAWISVTADAIVEKSTDGNTGMIHWQVIQTPVSYSMWRLTNLSTNTVVDQGTLSPINANPSSLATATGETEAMISSTDYPLLLTGELDRKIALLATSLSREQTGDLATHTLARQGGFATLYFGYTELKRLSPAASPIVLTTQLGQLHRQADRLLSAQPSPVR